jgi:hypothetical protein
MLFISPSTQPHGNYIGLSFFKKKKKVSHGEEIRLVAGSAQLNETFKCSSPLCGTNHEDNIMVAHSGVGGVRLSSTESRVEERQHRDEKDGRGSYVAMCIPPCYSAQSFLVL